MTTHTTTATAEGRFDDRIRRSIEAATQREADFLGVPRGPMTTKVAMIALTVAEARELLGVLESARVVVRTRGAGQLATALAKLDEVSRR